MRNCSNSLKFIWSKLIHTYTNLSIIVDIIPYRVVPFDIFASDLQDQSGKNIVNTKIGFNITSTIYWKEIWSSNQFELTKKSSTFILFFAFFDVFVAFFIYIFLLKKPIQSTKSLKWVPNMFLMMSHFYSKVVFQLTPKTLGSNQ